MRAICVYSLSFPFLSLTDGIVIHAVIQSPNIHIFADESSESEQQHSMLF